jgi:tRNA threonylcarbamoyladenosine biosynthesis protein TsaE
LPSQSLNSLSWDSSSPADTARIAARVGRRLRPGHVVYLRGELGAGKTEFVQAACLALGVTDPVTSPTYTVGNTYRSPAGAVSHLDLYRSHGLTDEEWGDLEPYFDDAICMIEWPEAGEGVLPPPTLDVTLRITGPDARLILLVTKDPQLGRSLADPEP